MLKIVVLVSGGGTNLQAILDAVATGDIVNAEVAGVISNNKGAPALVRSKAARYSGAMHISPGFL